MLERTEPIDAGFFDIPGFVLGGAGLGLFMYGISEGPYKSWSSPMILLSCVIGVVLLGVMAMVELRTTRPMVDLRLLMGRATTFFSTMRQVGSAVGVAILATVLVAATSNHGGDSSAQPDIHAYHFAFFTAAAFAMVAIGFSLSIHDVDAVETIVRRGRLVGKSQRRSLSEANNAAARHSS
jgi:hypothetical protein